MSFNKKHIKRILTPTIFLVLLIVFSKKSATAQQYQAGNFGINVGVVLALGTHFDRFGVSLNSYYQKDAVQVNSALKFYFNAKNIGPNQQYVEGVASLGIVYSFGTKDTSVNYFYSSVSNQTHKKNSVGYAYNYYFNTIKTSQFTGTISIQVSDFNLIAENDIFAQPILDRFRTGAFLFQYQKDKFLYGINATLFTGQMGQRVTDENYPFNHVYENTVGGKYTESSNGLLSAQVQYAGAYYQTYQGSIGVDSERIRHAIQNRFVHDFLVVQKHINAHVPMLDENGNQYLFKEGQKIKPMKFYFNGFSNPSIFY